MVYKKDVWLAVVKKTVEDLKAATPSAGKPTAIATMRYIRDALLDDLFGDGAGMDADEKAQSEAIRESFKELIKGLSKDGATEGFASNASAAAKAAGFKTTSAAMTEIEE